MRRPDKAGGKAVKTQRRKTVKRRNATKPARHRRSPAAGKDTNVAELIRERDEALEQQAATVEVLKVISRSTFDLPKVLNSLVEAAARLCEADTAQILRPSGKDESYYTAASYRLTPDFKEHARTRTLPPGRGTVVGRVLLERKSVQVSDVFSDPEYTSGEAARLGGWRTLLGVPLLREGIPIGLVVLHRAAVRPFTDKQIELIETFAAQAVIAIENTRLLNELRQSLEQQTATSEVLQVISSSPGELEPVFNAMLANATHICEAKFGTIFQFDGERFRCMAEVGSPPVFAEFLKQQGSFQPLKGSQLDRIMRTKQVSHTADYAAEGIPSPKVKFGGARSTVDVPMLKDNELVGAFSIYRQEVRPFTDKQIALLTNFAAQAVIAIENTRLLNELRESLQQQTATADVLKVISRSTFDLQTVLDTLVESAARLCGAEMANIWRPRDGAYRLTASYGVTARYKESLENKEFLNTIAIEPGRGTTVGRVLLERKSVHIHDIQADPDYKLSGLVALGGTRTMLGIPMLREGDPIGVLVLVQSAVRPFTDKQIELATTFADQAVIAIENVRLFEEVQARTRDLSESLEQQTATSEVLQVISSSAGELKPVFETMLESAVRICGAKFGNLLLVEGDAFRHVALHGAPQAYLEERRRVPVIRPRPGSDLDRIRSTKQIVHVADMQLEGPATAAIVELAGARTFLNVPMLKDNELIGTIGIYRQEVRPFTDKQIELVN